ncbi:MAG: hypothetical protein COB79_05925 [Zetaproteobacteria bacterium]|nr:MAG: hypothetical protein COB79_05925 [Zetaproteobacteria bacterium]
MKNNSLNWYDNLDQDLEYIAEDKKINAAITISRRMDQLNMSKADLAKKISSSPAYITKVLRGDSNLTIESLVKLSDAIDADLQINICPRASKVHFDTFFHQHKTKEQSNAWLKTSGTLNFEEHQYRLESCG